jgi:hypothetical protein
MPAQMHPGPNHATITLHGTPMRVGIRVSRDLRRDP